MQVTVSDHDATTVAQRVNEQKDAERGLPFFFPEHADGEWPRGSNGSERGMDKGLDETPPSTFLRIGARPSAFAAGHSLRFR